LYGKNAPKLDVITIHTTVKMHGQLVTRSTRHTVNSSQRCYTRRSTRHTIFGDFWVWGVDRVTSWLYPARGIMRTCGHADRQRKITVKRDPVVMFRLRPEVKCRLRTWPADRERV